MNLVAFRYRNNLLLLWLIVVLALTLRIWGLDNGLPYAQLPEESNEIKRSFQIAAGEIPTYTFHRTFWSLTQLPVHGIRFLYLKLTRPGFSRSDFEKLYFTERETFIRTARYMAAVLGGIAIIPAYFIGATMLNSPGWGLLTALLCAVHPTHVYLSHFGYPLVYATLWVMLTLLASMRLSVTGANHTYILIGALVALSTLTRMDTFIVIVSPLAAHCIYWKRKRSLYGFCTAWLWILPGFILATLLANPFCLFAPKEILNDIQFIFSQHVGMNSPFMEQIKRALRAYTFPIETLRPYILIFATVGGIWGLWQRNSIVAILFVFVGCFCLYLLPAKLTRVYYWLPAAMPSCLLAVYCIKALNFRIRYTESFLSIALFIVLLIVSLKESITIDLILSRKNTRMLAHDFIIQNVPPGARILTGDTFVYGVPLLPTIQSIERMKSCQYPMPPFYDFLLKYPQSITRPRYELYTHLCIPIFEDENHLLHFLYDNKIDYIIQTDYCTNSMTYGVVSNKEYPYISPLISSKFNLIEVFSPFKGQDCKQEIGECFHLEKMHLKDFQRAGPIIRIYAINKPEIKIKE